MIPVIDKDYVVIPYGYVYCVSKRKVMKTTRHNNRLQVTLRIDGKNKSYYLHRLVAQAHVSNPKSYRIAKHIDGDVYNNAADNLEWVYSVRRGKYNMGGLINENNE